MLKYFRFGGGIDGGECGRDGEAATIYLVLKPKSLFLKCSTVVKLTERRE